MRARISPQRPPYSPAVQASLDRVMPAGVPPLGLFTTLARDERLFERLFSGGLLDKGHLALREREIVIHRVTARCGSEYEWGVHAAFFAARVKLTGDQMYSLVHGDAGDACWDSSEQLLVALCDELHDSCTVSEDLWNRLRTNFSENALIELLMLAGYYRTISYLTNGLELPLEVFARRFPARESAGQKGSTAREAVTGRAPTPGPAHSRCPGGSIPAAETPKIR